MPLRSLTRLRGRPTSRYHRSEMRDEVCQSLIFPVSAPLEGANNSVCLDETFERQFVAEQLSNLFQTQATRPAELLTGGPAISTTRAVHRVLKKKSPPANTSTTAAQFGK